MLLTQQKFISLPGAPTGLQGAPSFLLRFQGWRMPGGVFGPMWTSAPLPALPPAACSPGVPTDNRAGGPEVASRKGGAAGTSKVTSFQVCVGVGPGLRGPARGDSHSHCSSRAPGGSASQLQAPLLTPFFPPFPGAPQHCPAPRAPSQSAGVSPICLSWYPSHVGHSLAAVLGPHYPVDRTNLGKYYRPQFLMRKGGSGLA